jgi:la-related protein 1
VPTPRTRLSFPIDRLRQEILSQLEFYLSPDNMATDLYLRKQVGVFLSILRRRC